MQHLSAGTVIGQRASALDCALLAQLNGGNGMDCGMSLTIFGIGGFDMGDRELLSLAAKANWRENSPIHISNEGFMDWVRDTKGEWNPLTDDGDALRLAVKLKLPIRDGLNQTVITGNEASGRPIWELYGDDPYAATRRAIVRAAAEIGKAMP